MGETNAILGRRKRLTPKKLFHKVEEIYFKNFSDKKQEDNVQSIMLLLKLYFCMERNRRKKSENDLIFWWYSLVNSYRKKLK